MKKFIKSNITTISTLIYLILFWGWASIITQTTHSFMDINHWTIVFFIILTMLYATIIMACLNWIFHFLQKN